MVPELAKADKKSPLKPFGAQLEEQAKLAVEALDDRNKARSSRTTQKTEIDEWKDGVNRLRLATYGALLDIAAQQSLHRKWADDFFRTGKVAEEDVDVDPASPAEPSQPNPPTPPVL
jgi:hypothetical protein